MKSLSPRAIVIGAALATVAIAVFGAAGLVWRFRAVPTGLQQRTMPDGTILVLEQVTTGGTHDYTWTQRTMLPAPFVESASERVSAAVPPDWIVVWFSRYDSKTGASLDFDWWLRAVAVDDAGNEMPEIPWWWGWDAGGIDCFAPGKHHSDGGGARPYRLDPADTWEAVVAHGVLRPFRHAGSSFKYRVYDASNRVVAEFDVPHQIPDGLPDWAPESLPATKHADDLDVTLFHLTPAIDRSSSEADYRARHHIKPEFQVTRDGRAATNEFDIEGLFEDAFGNGWELSSLSPLEPAWKLHVLLWPRDDADSLRASVWHAGAWPIPAADASAPCTGTATLDGIKLDLVSIGGSGTVVYGKSAVTTGHGTHGTAGRLEGTEYHLELDRGNGRETLTVKSPLNHMLLDVSAVDADHRLQARARDDRQRHVPATAIRHYSRTVVFLKPESDATSIDVTFVVQHPTRVEYLVAPPAEMRRPGR